MKQITVRVEGLVGRAARSGGKYKCWRVTSSEEKRAVRTSCVSEAANTVYNIVHWAIMRHGFIESKFPTHSMSPVNIQISWEEEEVGGE